MTLDEFISKYDGKGIDFDGSFGNQCVDLYRQYLKDVLRLPQTPPVVGAKDIWTTYPKDTFEGVKNTPSGIPEKGDIIIWGSDYGKYGHVAVVTDANVNTFNCFSQNDPVGTLCRVRRYNSYKSVVGWLRKRGDIIDDMPQWLKTMYLERGVDITKPEGDIRGKVQEFFDKAKKYDENEKRIRQLEKNLEEARGEAAQYEASLETARESVSRLEKEVDEVKKQVVARDTDISNLEKQISDLQKAVDPETKIILDKEVYYRLIKRKQLDRATDNELITTWLRRKKDNLRKRLGLE